MRNAFGAGIGGACLEFHIAYAFGLLKSQRTGSQRHYDIVVGVNVVAGFGTGREAPFRDDHSIGFDLKVRDGFHRSVGIYFAISPAAFATWVKTSICLRTALSYSSGVEGAMSNEMLCMRSFTSGISATRAMSLPI